MADIIKSIVTRIDTTANWTTLNPIPASGEQCIEILGKGLFKLKIGDGVTPWISLQYEVIGQGFSQFKILLDKEIKARIEADKALQDALDAEISRSIEKDEELDETIGQLSDYITESIENKLDKVNNIPNIIYGTDENGNQTVYDKESFGQVDDVRVNGESVVVDKIANIDIEADKIEYTIATRPSIDNVKEALDDIMSNIYYEEPTVVFNVTKADSYDVGATVSAPIDISWKFSKQPYAADKAMIYLNNQQYYNIIANDMSKWKQGSIQYPNDLSPTSPASYTFKIEYEDKHTTLPDGKTGKTSGSKTISFYYRRYWGTTTTPTLSNEQLQSLSNEKSGGRTQTRDFNCSGGKYWWFAIPTIYCNGIVFKDSSGFDMTLPPECISTRTITNSLGVSYQVNVYRTEFKQTDSSVKITVA